jgi:glycosyltransferase involved in cell wall biosynthesis
MIRLLLITTLYPNAVQQRHGIFVETRLRQLLATGEVEAEVIAPVPWFPFSGSHFGEYGRYRQVPAREQRHGVTVHHPRYLVIPKVGMLLTPFFLALSLWLTVARLRRQGLRYDLVDGHYYYPDGVAIALLARVLGRPFTVTARGTDINLIPKHRLPRRMILWASRRAAASIAVCRALKDEMVALGAEADKIHVLRNGVDLTLFHPLPREACRQRHGLRRTTLLSVGHLIERKGHDHVIDALAELPDAELMIAGDGEEQPALEAQVQRRRLGDRVHFLGALSQDQLASVYSAADILVLASSREGWANVLLESMACGTPVVATSIWGTPEVVKDPRAGVLVEERSGSAIAAGVKRLLAEYPRHEDTRAYAENFSWDATVSGLMSLLRELAGECPPAPGAAECGRA